MTGIQDPLDLGQHEDIFRRQILADLNFEELSSYESPRAIILAGQPGAA